MNTLGLYIHIPFCLRKCAYCDFVSYPERTALVDAYIDAVLAEALLYDDVLSRSIVDSVFIGGGTPSLLSPEQMDRLISGLKAVSVWQDAEVTVEANPETITDDKLKAYAQCGINRLSIGLQTHDNAILQNIGRRHTWETFLNAYQNAKSYYVNINVDLMFALPGQTTDGLYETVKRVMRLEPPHVSAYALKLEAGTPLAARFSGADEETDRAMYHGVVRMLMQAGYIHYETSNFAREGSESRHNLKYWTGGSYLGLGTAAYSYIASDVHERFGNVEDLDSYIRMTSEGIRPVAEAFCLTDKDILTEYIMLRLRLSAGIDFDDYHARFGGHFPAIFSDAIHITQKAGLITVDERGIKPTLKGFDLQNTLIGEFIKKL